MPYANETLLFYSRLAARLGLYKIQAELEDLAFHYLNPQRYNRVKELKAEYEIMFARVYGHCSREINDNCSEWFQMEIFMNTVPIYSSYSMLQEGSPLSDIFSINVITDTTPNCYMLLGVIHTIFKPSTDRFSDEIAVSKNKFNKHLQTTVLVNGHEVTFKIYSKGTRDQNIVKSIQSLSPVQLEAFSSEILRNSIGTIKTISTNPIQFYDLIATELLQKDITVHTPKMDSVSLPDGSTVFDFAFYQDPVLAARMSSVFINGVKKPLHTRLKENEIIEIIVEEYETVREDWLNFTLTAKAAKEIKWKDR